MFDLAFVSLSFDSIGVLELVLKLIKIGLFLRLNCQGGSSGQLKIKLYGIELIGLFVDGCVACSNCLISLSVRSRKTSASGNIFDSKSKFNQAPSKAKTHPLWI